MPLNTLPCTRTDSLCVLGKYPGHLALALMSFKGFYRSYWFRFMCGVLFQVQRQVTSTWSLGLGARLCAFTGLLLWCHPLPFQGSCSFIKIHNCFCYTFSLPLCLLPLLSLQIITSIDAHDLSPVVSLTELISAFQRPKALHIVAIIYSLL